MTESLETQSIFEEFGHMPVVGRIPEGIIFRKSRDERVASLRNFPVHHYLNGELQPVITDWKVGSAGEWAAPGLAPRIFSDNEIQILGTKFRFKPHSVGYVTLDPLSYNMVRQLPTGYVSGDTYIIEVGIYSYRVQLLERNQLKVELHLPEKPPNLSGDYFVVANEILDTTFYEDKFIEPNELYDDGKIRFDAGRAHDADGNYILVKNIVKTIGGKKYLVSGVPSSWLDTAVYPVVIDPSVTLQQDETNVKDAWGFNDTPSENHNDSDLWTGVQNNSTRASWLRMNLSSITNYGGMIESTLSLYLNYSQDITTSMQVYVSPLRRNFGETTVSWAYYAGTSTWTTSPGTNTTTDRWSETASWYTGTGIPATGFKDFDVGTMVDYWLNGTRSNEGWLLFRVATGESTCGVRFGSSGATSTQRPKLYINYLTAQVGAMPVFFS